MRGGRVGTAAVAACLCLVVAGAVRIRGAAEAQAPQAAAGAPAPIRFDRDIRPILANNCFYCHGPDDKRRETDFHFDTEEGAFLVPGIIVRGDAANSELIRRITHPSVNDRMPPSDSGYSLTQPQIDLLRRWINEGAKWTTHWAYAAPKRGEPPAVSHESWVRNPIDRFVLARLDQEKLRPALEADKVSLLRRVTYDLTGLPPTPADVDSFVNDRSPDAYEKRVDALLRSPKHGERMAMPWLDAARYADSHGYHIDSVRGMWPWRDWVINAFNRNLPFDQFVIEQLAGDLLPNATRDQKVASGFNRNHMINFEGGAIADEYQVEYVMDRVEATSSTFMGLTMGCARCHTHKFDPITHKEFYEFFAFFNNVPERGLDGRTGNAEPLLLLPAPAEQQRLDQLDAAIAERQRALAPAVVGPLQTLWEQTVAATFKPIETDGLTAYFELDNSFLDSSGRFRNGRTIAGDPTFDVGRVGRTATFDGDTEASFGDAGSFDRANPFSVAVWLRGRGKLPIAILQKVSDGDPAHRRGYEWSFDDVVLSGVQRWAARLTVTLQSDGLEQSIQLRTRDRLMLGDWAHVTMTYDGSGRVAGLRLYVNGKLAETTVLHDSLSGSFATDAPLRVGSKALGKPFNGQLDDLRFYERVLTQAQVEALAIHGVPRTIVSGVFARRSNAEATEVREYFLNNVASESLRTANTELKRLQAEKQSLERSIPSAMVMGELRPPRESFVLARGDYRNKTE